MERLPKGITKRGNAYRVTKQVNGKRSFITCKTLEEAQHMVDVISNGALPDHQDGRLAIWTFEQACDAYIEHKLRRSRQTKNNFKVYTKKILDHWGPNTKLDNITPIKVIEFHDAMEDAGLSGSYVSSLASHFNQLQKLAYRLGRMSRLPVKMSYGKRDKGRDRFLSDDEELRMLDWFDRGGYEDMKGLFIFYLDTGARNAEAHTLQWSSVDLHTGTIRFEGDRTKNGQTRMVKMSRRLALEFKRIYLLNGGKSGFVFGHVSKRGFERKWLEVRDALGFGDDKQFVIHMLRHTCCTRLLSAGVDIRTVMQWMGHHDIKITQRYAHFVPSKLDDVVDALDNLHAKTKAGVFKLSAVFSKT